MANLPFYGTAFNVSVSLYTSTGLIANVGTLTCKISKDYGDWGDCHGTGATDEDTTYGQVKVALDATDMTAYHIDGYVIDDTSGCFAAKFAIDTIPVVRGLAGTALPNAAADAAGGLPISDAGSLDLDTLLAILSNGTYGLAAIKALIAAFATDADVADAVLDELVADHTNAGSLSKAVSDILLLLNAAHKGSFQAAADTPSAGYTTWTLYDLDDNLIATFVTTDATGSRAKAT